MFRSVGRMLTVAACGLVVLATGAGAASARTTHGGNTRPRVHAACNQAPAGRARCLAEYRTDTPRQRWATAGTPPKGFGPADLRSAYKLPATGGTGKTVAIVDAFGYPSAEADLAVYRKQYGLPACTVASGCLRIVNQDGNPSPLPAPDPGWGVETALDLDMASAACPDCKLLLVEGNDPGFENLATSVDTAVKLGASVVSNSYGADEFNGMDAVAHSYNHPGVPILVSSGDNGFKTAEFPSVLPTVISVGGTSLKKDNSARGWTETAWSGAGSGCSAWVTKPAWQKDKNCTMRTTADISAVADPDTGVAVYDTYGLGDQAGWQVIGGTSASTPFLAGMITLAGHPETVTPQKLYAEPKAFHDVTGGSNGFCGGDYLCTGLPGYDGPTGLGTPNGTKPFE